MHDTTKPNNPRQRVEAKKRKLNRTSDQAKRRSRLVQAAVGKREPGVDNANRRVEGVLRTSEQDEYIDLMP